MQVSPYIYLLIKLIHKNIKNMKIKLFKLNRDLQYSEIRIVFQMRYLSHLSFHNASLLLYYSYNRLPKPDEFVLGYKV